MDDEMSLIYRIYTRQWPEISRRKETKHQSLYITRPCMGTSLVCLSRILDHYAEMVHETLQGISLDLMLAVGAYGNVQKKIEGPESTDNVYLTRTFLSQLLVWSISSFGILRQRREGIYSSMKTKKQCGILAFVSILANGLELLSISGLFSVPAGQALTGPPTKTFSKSMYF